MIDYASCSRGEKQVRTKPFPAEPHLKTERKAEQDISCSGVEFENCRETAQLFLPVSSSHLVPRSCLISSTFFQASSFLATNSARAWA